MAKYAEVNLPVLVGDNYSHIIAQAAIDIEGDNVTITIQSAGKPGRELVDVLTSGEIVALSFGAIPVKPHTTKEIG